MKVLQNNELITSSGTHCSLPMVPDPKDSTSLSHRCPTCMQRHHTTVINVRITKQSQLTKHQSRQHKPPKKLIM